MNLQGNMQRSIHKVLQIHEKVHILAFTDIQTGILHFSLTRNRYKLLQQK